MQATPHSQDAANPPIRDPYAVASTILQRELAKHQVPAAFWNGKVVTNLPIQNITMDAGKFGLSGEEGETLTIQLHPVTENAISFSAIGEESIKQAVLKALEPFSLLKANLEASQKEQPETSLKYADSKETLAALEKLAAKANISLPEHIANWITDDFPKPYVGIFETETDTLEVSISVASDRHSTSELSPVKDIAKKMHTEIDTIQNSVIAAVEAANKHGALTAEDLTKLKQARCAIVDSNNTVKLVFGTPKEGAQVPYKAEDLEATPMGNLKNEVLESIFRDVVMQFVAKHPEHYSQIAPKEAVLKDIKALFAPTGVDVSQLDKSSFFRDFSFSNSRKEENKIEPITISNGWGKVEGAREIHIQLPKGVTANAVVSQILEHQHEQAAPQSAAASPVMTPEAARAAANQAQTIVANVENNGPLAGIRQMMGM